MSSATDNKKLSDLVKLHIKIFGPYVAVSTAKELSSLKVSDLGEVQLTSGAFEQVYQSLIDKYISLGGMKPL